MWQAGERMSAVVRETFEFKMPVELYLQLYQQLPFIEGLTCTEHFIYSEETLWADDNSSIYR